MAETSGWNVWAKQVANEIEKVMRGVESNHTDIVELKRQLTKLQETVNMALTECQSVPEMKVDIARLKVKAGIWGLIGGTIPVIVMILFRAFR